MGAECTCSKARYTSSMVSKYFFIVHFTNFTNAPACLLLWWLHDITTAQWIFRFLQNSWNFSRTKFVPGSGIIFLRSLFSENISHTLIKLSALSPSVCLTTDNLLWYSTIHKYVASFSINMSTTTVSHGFPGMSCHISLSFGCVAWNLGHFKTMFNFPYNILILTQYTYSHVSNMVFLYLCVCCIAVEGLIIERKLVFWFFYPSSLSHVILQYHLEIENIFVFPF